MNYGPLLFLGVFFTLVTSWCGMVLVPQLQIGRLSQAPNIEDATEFYPQLRPGQARQGQEVYRAHGCAECHTQQVRPKGLGADLERGWGKRRSVAADYLYDQPVMTGTLRIGPDLANFGARETNRTKLLVHLYNPQISAPGSMMPPYKFLFEERKSKPAGRLSADALPLEGAFAPGTGYEIVPRAEAAELVEYLLSLHSDVFLFEVPPPFVATNAAPGQMGATNGPAVTATNAAAINPAAPPAK